MFVTIQIRCPLIRGEKVRLRPSIGQLRLKTEVQEWFAAWIKGPPESQLTILLFFARRWPQYRQAATTLCENIGEKYIIFVNTHILQIMQTSANLEFRAVELFSILKNVAKIV